MRQGEDEKSEQEQGIAEKLEEAMRQVLTPDAKSRLGNVRLVNHELYLKAAQAIIYLAQSGRLKEKISEPELKQLLLKLSEKRESKIKIRRK